MSPVRRNLVAEIAVLAGTPEQQTMNSPSGSSHGTPLLGLAVTVLFGVVLALNAMAFP
jgi:hypothetical protein